MVRTPRDAFVAGAHCAEFKAIYQSEAFEAATSAALLEMTAETCQQGLTPNQAADAGNQMAGAKRYLEILCTIWQPTEKVKQQKPPNLDYRAGV